MASYGSSAYCLAGDAYSLNINGLVGRTRIVHGLEGDDLDTNRIVS